MSLWSQVRLALLLLAFAAPASAGDWDDLYKEEAAQIVPFADRVRRDGDILRLALRNGRETTLRYPPGYCDGPEDCVVYNFGGYLEAADSYVIAVRYYEQGDYMLVDSRTGAETKIGAAPHIDPSGTRFIAVGTSEMEGNLNGFEMWSLTPDGPRMERRYETTELFTFRAWNTPRIIELTHWIWSDAANEKVPVDARLLRIGSGWKLAAQEIDELIPASDE